jgi:hypothetical protein
MKIDLYQLHKKEYAAPKKPTLVHIGPANYLAIEGRGRPGDAGFTAQIGALYAVAFTVKMRRKFAGQQDYTICKLEAQWLETGCHETAVKTGGAWRWRLLIRTPDFVSAADLREAVAVLLEKGKPAEVKAVKLAALDEGSCVQMLHVGPYDREAETLATMTAFAVQRGLRPTGLHHEIYLSDPRRVPPERLKTILRQPVAKTD